MKVLQSMIYYLQNRKVIYYKTQCKCIELGKMFFSIPVWHPEKSRYIESFSLLSKTLILITSLDNNISIFFLMKTTSWDDTSIFFTVQDTGNMFGQY